MARQVEITMSKRTPASDSTSSSGPTDPVGASVAPSLFSQIAAKVGVTPAAVTLAMQDSSSISAATKQRVFWASRQLGYRYSRAKQKQLLNIAVVVGTTEKNGTLQSSRDVDIWEGLSSCAEENEMSLHTYILPPPGPRLEFKNLPVLLRRDQLDGVVIMGVAFPPLMKFLRKAHIPTVVASNIDLPTPTDQVRIDMFAGARALTLKLIELGHRHIGFLTNGCDLLFHKQLLSGYEAAMREHDLFNSKLIRLCPGSDLPGISPGDSLLAERPAPTAVVAPSATAAYHVAFAAVHARVPFDGGFTIATCKHSDALEFIYPTVHLNTHARNAGIRAFERLMELHANPKQVPKSLLVQCEIEMPQAKG